LAFPGFSGKNFGGTKKKVSLFFSPPARKRILLGPFFCPGVWGGGCEKRGKTKIFGFGPKFLFHVGRGGKNRGGEIKFGKPIKPWFFFIFYRGEKQKTRAELAGVFGLVPKTIFTCGGGVREGVCSCFMWVNSLWVPNYP